ncbi:MAG: sensor histidine kinase, partial [Acidimicrobiales bacterium]
GPSWSYFLLIGAVTLAIAAAVAYAISRRISRPLVDAVSATRRIAAGDLGARVPVSPNDYRELTSLADSINTMAASLGRARGQERQFLLSVSHDLRTPLTSIRGFAEAIAEGAAPDAQRAAVVIASESRRLERLVQDLLELAKLDSRRFSLSMGAVDSGEVVSDTAEGFRPMVEKAGLSLDLRVPDEPALWVTADPDRLAQILANLMENAYNYSHRRITVSTGAHNGRVVVAVEDDGPGIGPDDLAQVFQRMFQTSRTPSRQAGSGLGLTIVSELAEAMGAGVHAESPITADGGTRMVLSLRTWAASQHRGDGVPHGDAPR